jgi:type II secretory pathway pseudopilin PulG
MRPSDGPGQEAGFTLIEVIISFVILATVLGSVALSWSYSAGLQRKSEARQRAMNCSERVVAEKFDRKPGLPPSESGIENDDCRWRISRLVARTAYTESGRNLMSFRLDVMDRQGQKVEDFQTYYVEDLP